MPEPPPQPGTVTLPSGARVRGRRLADQPETPADFLLALADGPLPAWPHRRIDWPDFSVPSDRADALDALAETLRRARAGEVVEVACRGGRGRTGTALAALAVLDGMPAKDAVRWVRREYDSHAVETPWQSLWVRRLPNPRRDQPVRLNDPGECQVVRGTFTRPLSA